eukprot:SAG22_NODE_688_length_7907_cov_7.557505_1_plen_108_part_10
MRVTVRTQHVDHAANTAEVRRGKCTRRRLHAEAPPPRAQYPLDEQQVARLPEVERQRLARENRLLDQEQRQHLLLVLAPCHCGGGGGGGLLHPRRRAHPHRRPHRSVA